jgi:hypothetical protein
MIPVVLVPEDALKLMLAYSKSEWAFHLVAVNNGDHTDDLMMNFQVQQDGLDEPLALTLFHDGTWKLAAKMPVSGDTE